MVLAQDGKLVSRSTGLSLRYERLSYFLRHAAPKGKQPGEHPQSGPPRTNEQASIDPSREGTLRGEHVAMRKARPDQPLAGRRSLARLVRMLARVAPKIPFFDRERFHRLINAQI
jgi:hypothetical protein